MPIATETTTYRAEDGAAVSTYLARPQGSGPFPAVLMAYEFWGMLEVPGGGPHMRDVAGRFAAAGYVAAISRLLCGPWPAADDGRWHD